MGFSIRAKFPLMLMMSVTLLLSFTMSSPAFGQATSITSTGFRATEGGGGAITAEYTTGNLGNTWAEGEWVSYQLIIDNVQTDYPNLDGFPMIKMSYDYTSKGHRFVDLVRAIQISNQKLVNGEGYPMGDGTAFPVSTREEIEIAQNEPNENIWNGFAPLNLPDTQMNRAFDLSEGTPDDAEHVFYITRDDVIAGLTAAGLPLTVDTIIIFYQLHESRSFVWFNSLQSQYNAPPTDHWGGYLYGTPAYAADSRNGSGYVPGSSGHIEVEFASGAKTVPIPIPERLPGAVSGLKWRDQNGNGMMDMGEETLSGWRIFVEGTLENINFETSTLTDELGNYSFPNLTSNVVWTISEDVNREAPFEDNFMQTYPMPGTVLGVGTGVGLPSDPNFGDYGWEVALTRDFPEQGDMNFGNKQCELTLFCPPNITIDCTDPDDPSFTGSPTYESNCGPVLTDFVDNIIPGDCLIDGYLYQIERTFTATDGMDQTETCVQVITVIDDTPPVISGVGDDFTIECDQTPVFSEPTVSDNCDPDPSLTFSDQTTPGSCPQEYSITRTWTATDACGNTSQDSQTIHVVDTTDPVISGVGDDHTIECTDDPVFSEPTVSDNCDPDPSLTFSDEMTPGDCPQEYSVTRTWTATDACGNTSTDSQTIYVVDTTPPTITCPADIDVNCDESVDYGVATAVDNCDPDPTIGYTDVVVNETCPREVHRTWTATDACDNSASCTQVIIIRDETPPVITGVGDDYTIQCDEDPVFSDPAATDNCDTDPSLTFEDFTTDGRCPQEYSITRVWTATDFCNNVSADSQTIYIVDNIAPVISGVGNDTTYNCTDDPVFSMPTVSDNCDPDPSLTFSDQMTAGDCPQEYSVTRTWMATDACGNTSQDSQTIYVVDNTPPVITGVGDDATISCDAEPVFSTPTASDDCDPDPSLMHADDTTMGDCPYNYSVTRTWTATDTCGNSATASQTITVEDSEAPMLTCAPDDTIACEEDLVFTPPTATDNCDPDPMITEVSFDSTAGPGDGQWTYVMCWTATDTCGNISDQCCQTIIREACDETGCTFTIGGWGNICPESQMGDMYSTQPGCVRDHYFSTVFPGGEVVIGHNSGYTARWTSAMAIEYYLPAGSTPAVLTGNLVNPGEMEGNVLVSQILALTLNREYICSGVFYDLGLWPDMGCYGDYMVGSCGGGMFDDMTVDEFLEFANKVVSGKTNMLNGYNASLSDVNYTATCLNELYSDCDPYADIVDMPSFNVPENNDDDSYQDPTIPTEFGLSQNSPNPFNPVTEISFSLPEASYVRLSVYNVLGQVVANLVDGNLEAGFHSASWNGNNVASGIYLYRLEVGNMIFTRKMVLMK